MTMKIRQRHGNQPAANATHKDPSGPTKLDYAIAKELKNNLPSKEAMFVGIKRVNYFIGAKAVDHLMESKHHKDKFQSRNECILFLNDLLLKKFFHRAKKIVKTDGGKRKFKLDMHDIQIFEDSKEPYVWLYEPTSLMAWLICLVVIFAVVGICLFPLWPPIIRSCCYYLCIASLVLLSSFLALSVLRHVIFFILWALTFGKVHFWLLPNLTEDVGFLESFQPIYTLETAQEAAASAAAAAAATCDGQPASAGLDSTTGNSED